MPTRSLPSVSILVAAFKAHRTIRRTIESALGQTYPHLEVVVSPDDGTTYNEIRDWCKSPRVKLLKPPSEVGSGPALTRNRAIDASRGDFLCILDADDYVTPRYVEALVDIAAEDGIAAATLRYVTEAGAPVRTPEIPPGIITVPGFGQGLCSLKPMAHRSLETGFCDTFAEDVLHDAILLARTGGARVASDASYETVVHQTSLCASSGENRVIEAYTVLAADLVSRPTRVQAQALSLPERREIAELFAFRAFVSACYENRHGREIGYHEFVRGREASLWDEFIASPGAAPAKAA